MTQSPDVSINMPIWVGIIIALAAATVLYFVYSFGYSNGQLYYYRNQAEGTYTQPE